MFAWAAFALVLIAAEVLAPGAFMLWMGLARKALVFLAVWLLPGIPLLAQVAGFVVLSFISIQVYRTWFRKRELDSGSAGTEQAYGGLGGAGGTVGSRHRQWPWPCADCRCVLGCNRA